MGSRQTCKELRDLISRRGESDVRRTAYSWRTAHAGIRCFRPNHLALGETRPKNSGSRRAMAGLFSQSSGGHRRDGFTVPMVTFRCFAASLSSATIGNAFCTALQRHPASDEPTDCPQLREAFLFESAPKFPIFDRDTKHGLEVPKAVRSLKMEVLALFSLISAPEACIILTNGLPEPTVEIPASTSEPPSLPKG